jgi:hypothetical protein
MNGVVDRIVERRKQPPLVSADSRRMSCLYPPNRLKQETPAVGKPIQAAHASIKFRRRE